MLCSVNYNFLQLQTVVHRVRSVGREFAVGIAANVLGNKALLIDSQKQR